MTANYNGGSIEHSYSYDVAGNMVNYDGVNRTYNAANQMTNDGTNTLSYDNNGNLTGNGTDTYTWDRANRLLSVGNHSYVYDGLGNRVQQTVSSVVTDYLNDIQPGLTKLLKQSTGANVEQFVHAPRGIHAVDDGTDWNYYAQDGLGSVRALVDDMAVVQTSMSFDPYGNPMASYGAGFGFTGEQTDANGSVFLRARYYEPSMCVFNALDPMEGKSCTPMSLNRYGYVHGNPILMTDPSGKIKRSNLSEEVFGVPRAQYSCRFGWIDWDHVNPINPANLIRTIENAINSNLYTSANSDGMVFRTTYDSRVVGLTGADPLWHFIPRTVSDSDVDLYASVIFGLTVRWLETLTNNFDFGINLTGSGFSVEDLPSYMIGFNMALSLYYLNALDELLVNGTTFEETLIPAYQEYLGIVQDDSGSPNNVELHQQIFDTEPSSYRQDNRSVLPPNRAPELDAFCPNIPSDQSRIPDELLYTAQGLLYSYNQLGETVIDSNEVERRCGKPVQTGYPNDPQTGPIQLFECDGTAMAANKSPIFVHLAKINQDFGQICI